MSRPTVKDSAELEASVFCDFFLSGYEKELATQRDHEMHIAAMIKQCWGKVFMKGNQQNVRDKLKS